MKKWVIALIVILIALAVAIGIYFKDYQAVDFRVTPDYPINMNLVSGAEARTSIKITNNEDEKQDFRVELNNPAGIASISETDFSLESKESKEIEISFKDVQNFSHVYFANLVITNTNSKKTIPVLLTFQEPAHPFAIIPKPMPRYFDVYPGGKLGVEINVYDLGIKDYAKEVKASYEILSPDKTVLYFEENLFIDGNSQFSKIFDIDSGLPYGNYVLVTSLEYKGLKSVSSYLFKVEQKQNEFFLDKTNLLILVFFVFVILIVVLFIYFIKSRDELLLTLRKQQSRELARNIELISAVQKRAPAKKEKLEKVKKEVVKKIKKKQEKQIKELKILKKKGVKKDKIKVQLEKWKKQGYEFPEIKKEIPEKSINKQIAEWKKKGFDTSFLSE